MVIFNFQKFDIKQLFQNKFSITYLQCEPIGKEIINK